MGIGTLRRYHDDSREAGLTPAPQGSEDATQEQIDTRTDEERGEEAREAGKLREFEAKRELNDREDEARELRDDPEATPAALRAAVRAVLDAEEAVEAAIAEDAADREQAAEGKRAADEEHERIRQEQAKADAAANPAGAPVSANDDGTAPEPSTDHGDVKRPTAQGSTKDWIAYAQADPNGSPVADLTERKGLRDEIAQAYLGK